MISLCPKYWMLRRQLYSPGIDSFWEDLAKGANRVFYFEEGPRDTPRRIVKTWLKMKDQKTLEAGSHDLV